MSKNKNLSTRSATERREYVLRFRPRWLIGVEAACYAGVKHERLYLALASGALPSQRIGRRFSIALDQVDLWISAGCPENPSSSPPNP